MQRWRVLWQEHMEFSFRYELCYCIMHRVTKRTSIVQYILVGGPRSTRTCNAGSLNLLTCFKYEAQNRSDGRWRIRTTYSLMVLISSEPTLALVSAVDHLPSPPPPSLHPKQSHSQKYYCIPVVVSRVYSGIFVRPSAYSIVVIGCQALHCLRLPVPEASAVSSVVILW